MGIQRCHRAARMADVTALKAWIESGGDKTAALKQLIDALHSVSTGALAPDVLVDSFSELAAANEGNEELVSALADALALVTVEFEEESKEHDNVAALLKLIISQELIPKDVAIARLEFSWLEEMNVIPSKDKLARKEVQVRTRMFFTQQKFNLFREESEGYSKLITELNQGLGSLTDATVGSVISNCQSLIGYFDLDPNRVFDVVLQAFEFSLHNSAFLRLIEVFKKDFLPHIVGFKFQQYGRKDTDMLPPDSLYRLSAELIKSGYLTLDTLYPHLYPEDGSAVVPAAAT